MKRVLLDVTPADLSRLDSVRSIIGLIEPIVNYEVPPGHRLRMRVEVEPMDSRPREERELEQLRGCLVIELADLNCCSYSDAGSLAQTIEALVSARVGRALRIHCDAYHDDEC